MTASLQIFQYWTPLFSPSILTTIAPSPAHVSILFLFFLPLILRHPHPVSLPRSLLSVDIWLLFADLKLRVPPTPGEPLMFDKGPLKCADFRGCLADGSPGLLGRGGEGGGALPSERDQLLPPPPFPSHPLL